MKGYKAFDKGLICKNKQYKENTVFEEEKAVPCKCGMHFCDYPLSVWRYYPPVQNGELTEYAEVEALDEPKTDDNEKWCSKKLKIGAKIGIPGLVKASVDYIINNVEKENRETNTGDRSASSVSGEDSVALAFGVDSKAKGAKGCYIALAEWKWDDKKDEYILLNFKSRKVNGKKIKADTFYKLVDGKFVEAE